MIVTLLGATGLVGGYVRKFLEESGDVSKLILPVRNIPEGASNTEKVEWIKVDFDSIKNYKEAFAADAVICCLGTTIKKAGSKKALEHVDLEIPLACAALAKANNVRHFLVISAQGANQASPYHYNRTKGLLEQGLSLMGFPSLTIVRPSLLLGKRKEKRILEGILQKVLSRNLLLIPASWRPVFAETVAAVIVAALQNPPEGTHIIYNRTIAQSEIKTVPIH